MSSECEENPVMRIDGIVDSISGMLVELSADLAKVDLFLLQPTSVPLMAVNCGGTVEKPSGWFNTHYQKLDNLRTRIERIISQVRELSNIVS
jgi:hypothetical protein